MFEHKIEKDLTEGVAKEVVIEMFDNAPNHMVASAAFGDESMDMRIPFKVTPKGMKNTDKAGSKVLRFIDFMKHAKNGISDSVKETGKQRAVVKEEDT